MNDKQDGTSKVPLHGKPLDYGEDGGKQQSAQSPADGAPRSYEELDSVTHLDNRHYMRAVRGLDQGRAFGPQPQYQS